MRHRVRLIAATAAALALAATGCSGTGGGADDKTLTVWMMTGGPGDSPVIADATKAFHREHPDITVDIQVQQWDNIVTKLTTALASGNPPDVVEMGNTQTPIQSYAGALSDLSAARSTFDDSTHWLGGLAASGVRDGRTYAAPLYGGTKVVLYRTDMFAKAGIGAPPTTLDELVTDCAKLRRGRPGTFSGMYLPGKYWFAGMPVVFGKAGPVATRNAQGRWSSRMSSPDAVAGLRTWQRVQNACSTTASVGADTNSPDQDQVFADGKAAMAYVKAWEPATVLEKNPKLADKLGYFVMPGYRASRTLPVIVAGSTVGVAAASPHQDLAKAYVRALTSRHFQQELATKLNLLPVSSTFLPADAPEQLKVAAKAVRVSQPLPNAPGEATLETERYNEQFFAKIAGGADPATAAKEYDRHVTDTLNTVGTK